VNFSLHFRCTNLFKHFEELAASGRLPEVEILEEAAWKLHRAYSSSRAVYNALYKTTATSTWSQTVPLETPWVPPSTIVSSEELPKLKKKGKKLTKKSPDDTEDIGHHPEGDRGLANSITFMQDAMMSHKMSYTIAEGDAGQVYEVMKVCLLFHARP
jgi:hypothetical protein